VGFFSLFSALLVSTSFLILVLWLVWWLDRYDREPLRLVVAVFGWGASFAVAISFMALSGLASVLMESRFPEVVSVIVGTASAPGIEETAKAIGVLLIVMLTNEFDNPIDGIVYGTSVGLGFAATENILYSLGTVSAYPGDTARMLIVIAGRTVMTAGVHAVCSACFGGFLGHAMLTGRLRQRTAWTVAGLFTAILLHTAWNIALADFGPVGESGTPRVWLLVLPGLYLVYLAIVAVFLKSEHRILLHQLEEEVNLGLAPSWVLDIIPYYRRRVRNDWWPSRKERTVIARLLTRLAFRKQALRNLPENRSAVASLEIVRLRQRVREVLGPAIEASK
jgi:RsiW-degrading membrane proteinase PrsW (M82 family)